MFIIKNVIIIIGIKRKFRGSLLRNKFDEW